MKKILHPYTLSLIRRFGQHGMPNHYIPFNIVHYLSHLPFIQKKTAAEEFFKGGEKLAGDGKEKSAERTRTAQ